MIQPKGITSALMPNTVAARMASRRRVLDDLRRRIATGDDLLVLAFSAKFTSAGIEGEHYLIVDGRLVNRAAVDTARSMWTSRTAHRIVRRYARSKAIRLTQPQAA